MIDILPKVGFISLGCPKATVDAERILTQLRAEGYCITSSYDEAGVVIVNTCGFINEAIEESLDAIGEALVENGRVIVTGCLGAQANVVKDNYPDVLAVTGPNTLQEVMSAVHTVLPPKHDPYVNLIPLGGIKLTPRHYAYLKIAEGCNQTCSFCIIPNLRGKHVSRAASEILNEAENLVTAGVKELLLVSQDTAAYGVDTKYHLDFWQGRPLKTKIFELVKHLGQLDAWIRLHYVYPYPHVDQLVKLMADNIILPYLDVPLQHATPTILKAMRRPADSENMLRRIEKWREICPDITLRSTFIVGFPGETEQDFEQLLDFLREAQLDRVGAFAYSNVEDAPANALPHSVEEEEKQARLAAFMDVQADISAEKLKSRIGKTYDVIIDKMTDDVVFARSAAEAPEIDGVIILEQEEATDLEIGTMNKVVITDADEHDLYARLVI